ncbi:MAG: hypothetical protein JOZ47_08040 [Kutzneria sp.]|nr:hypothetical protein [Kutzneria sp.]
MACLGSALFAAVDQRSAASLRGYLQDHSAAVSTRERFRGELAALLLSGGAAAASIRAAAARAHWPIPRETAAVLADPDNEVARALLSSTVTPAFGCARGIH